MSDEMIERARRIVKHPHLAAPGIVRWAEALLAEHDARVEAEEAWREAEVDATRHADARLRAERDRDEARAEADDLYHRWGRQVRYLVGILSRWERDERALCVGMTGGEPVVEPGSLIADTREAIAMARGDLDPERARAALGDQEQTDGS